MKYFNKIVASRFNPFISVLSSVGTVIGLIIILLTIDFYIDYYKLTHQSGDALNKDFLIITKKINELHTTGLLSTDFSDKELNTINEQPFFDQVIGFKKNMYEAYIESSSQNFPLKFSSLVTFEAIPNEFIDLEASSEWTWSSTSSYLPVIVPRSYMNMYNFGMADMQGLPVISEKMISNFTVLLKVNGNGFYDSYNTKIIGFSDRIESVLVPESFMDFSNAKFAKNIDQRPSKLIASTHDLGNPEIAKFLDKKGYFVNKEKLKGSTNSKLLNLTVSGIVFLGLLVLFLSLIGFIQQTQLKISKAQQKIYKLFILGATYNHLTKYYVKRLSVQFALLNAVAIVVVLCIRFLALKPFLIDVGIEYPVELNYVTFLIILLLLLVSFIYMIIAIRVSIRKIINP